MKTDYLSNIENRLFVTRVQLECPDCKKTINLVTEQSVDWHKEALYYREKYCEAMERVHKLIVEGYRERSI